MREGENMKKAREIVSVVFKAVALAMGVVVVILSALEMTSIEVSVLLLGIGLFCISVVSLQKSES